MNDFINRKLELLKRTILNLRNPYQRDKIRVQIEEFLENVVDENDKLQIIEFFNGDLERSLKHHKDFECSVINNNCVIEGNYDTALFFLKQELKKMEKENRSTFNNYVENLTINGSGNFLNVGNINGDIENNITILKSKGEQNIAEAFERLKNIINNENIGEEEKSLLLDNINTLSSQATLEKSKRLPINVIKTIFSGINVLSSLSTVAGIDFKNILEYFNQ